MQPKNLLRMTLAALLTVTLSGAYCLFCCQEIIAAVKSAHQTVSHAKGSENCHFSKKKAADDSKPSVRLSGLEGCSPRFTFFIAKLEKKEFPQQALVAANNFSAFLETVNSGKKATFTGFQYRAPILERRDLCIKNCVFRI